MRTHQDKLHQSRKLVLMVDLDNTLIHTTEMPCQCSPKKVLFIRSGTGISAMKRQCCGLALFPTVMRRWFVLILYIYNRYI